METLKFSVVNVLNIITLFVTTLFIFQIYFLTPRSKSKSFFTIYLINILVILIFFLILDLNFIKVAYALIPLLLVSSLSIGPLLWIYIKLIIGEKLNTYKKHFYIPLAFCLLTLALIIADYLIRSEAVSKYIIQINTYIILTGLGVVFVIQNVYYLYRSTLLYRKHLRNLSKTFSYTEKVNLSWFKLLLYGYLFFICGLIISHIVDDYISSILFNLILLSYVIYSGYNALKQEPVFENSSIESDTVESNTIENKQKKSILDLDPELKKQLMAKLLFKMEDEKLFLDSSLTIHSLASELNSNNKYISQLINNDLNKNFVMFVNSYRIREAKKLLLDEENKKLTIESIGYDAGFKSKSAFNRVFKQFTSQTPSEFKLTHQ